MLRFARLRSLLLLATLALSPTLTQAESADSEAGYSEGGWSTLHRSGANRRFAGDVPLADRYVTWQALAGASVLTAPTLSPDGQTLYVTTGRGV